LQKDIELYLKGLLEILENQGDTEKKAFLRPFIKKTVIDKSEG